MQRKLHPSFKLFLIASIVLFVFFLVSLPALANPSEVDTSTVTTDIFTQLTIPITETTTATLAQSTPAPPASSTVIITTSQILWQSYTITPTLTISSILTSTETSAPLLSLFSYLPIIRMDLPTPNPTPQTVLFCDTLGYPLNIPDNYPPGVNDVISITDQRMLVEVRLYLNISHSYVGDLVVTLTNLNTQHTITVINRPGSSQYHCRYDNIITILGDAAAQPVDDKCAAYPNAISGIYLPSESLQVFNSQTVNGNWRVNVSDHFVNDTGTLNHWCLEAKLADAMPAPSPSPTPIALPSTAYVGGMSGQDQQLSLDCESRSAVDWAKHYGVNIDEIHFLNHLPRSDDPEIGFVGNPDGVWGNTPPNDYGVHALPVANLLRDYGLVAASSKSLSWDELRAEIASGNPVIVWIIGDNSFSLVNGTPRYYTASSTGNTTIVARNEHTVILIGYSPSNVTILNGSHFVDIPLVQFLDSWSTLDFMAVLNHE